jgi:ribosomal-protein-alanine N-acetyltransferase
MILRKWEYTDILKIHEIEQQVFHSPWSYKMLADTFLSGTFTGIIAQSESTLFGYGGYINISGEADILKVAVVDCYRKQGVGDKILKEMIKECIIQGVSTISLEVRTSNKAAIKLYKNNNFDIIATREKYYINEDAYVMQRIF